MPGLLNTAGLSREEPTHITIRARPEASGEAVRAIDAGRTPREFTPLWIAAGDFEQPRGGCSWRRRGPLIWASGGAHDGPGTHLS